MSKLNPKDPGSAITHFIGMLMAIFAATPLLIKAATNPDSIHLIWDFHCEYDSFIYRKHCLPYI